MKFNKLLTTWEGKQQIMLSKGLAVFDQQAKASGINITWHFNIISITFTDAVFNLNIFSLLKVT